MKKLLKNKSFIIFSSVSLFVVALFTVVTVLSLTTFESLISIPLGGYRAVTSDSNELKYEKDFENKEAAKANGDKVNEEINEEGIVLLKNQNNALPLDAGSHVTVFGKNSVNLVYGGSGSSAANLSNGKTIFDSLEAVGFSYNPTVKAFYEDNNKSGPERNGNPTDLDSGGNKALSTAETPYSMYTSDVIGSYSSYNDCAIIVFSRIGGEGFDLPRKSSDDVSRHYLELDPNEMDLVRNVTSAGFKKVVLLINSGSVMELDFAIHGEFKDKIDAILTFAGPGETGAMALGKLLIGKNTDGTLYSPSGHTVDTWPVDFTKNPSWNNFGDSNVDDGDRYAIDGVDAKKSKYYFVDYEEGIYVGYRYYETRYKEEGASGDTWYQNNVVFPFGYGLSYTTFSWEVSSLSLKDGGTISNNNPITVKVKVKNTGDKYYGKDVVQLYASAPYTSGGIEKADKVLVGFAKTKLLKPGDIDTVEITFNPYDFASYDYNDANHNNNIGYELEKGTYTFHISSDAHTSKSTFSYKVDDDYFFTKDPVTETPVINRFAYADDQLKTVMSRSNFDGTWPTTRSEEERVTPNSFKAECDDRASNNPNNYTEMPIQNAEVTILFEDMAEEPYDSEKWEEFLNQLTIDEMADLFNNGAFITQRIERLQVNQTTNSDGCAGFVNFMSDPSIYGTCTYSMEVVLSSTWNVELAEKMGKAIGNEGLFGNVKGDGIPYSGWYAPGMNIHRSQFGGRNFEYFSEDPFISGKMAAAVSKGAKSKGVNTFMKHFVANDQETHRSNNGCMTWVDEQTLREIYLKPFEIAVKEAMPAGIMSSFNRLGTKYCGANYDLLTIVLRDEWGFEGTVISDFNTNSYQNSKQMVYGGGDLNLTTTNQWLTYDKNSANDVMALRKAAKNILYTVSKSNSLNVHVSHYLRPIWEIVLFVVDGVVLAGLTTWGVLTVLKIKKKEK